jgi:hypothetical protein
VLLGNKIEGSGGNSELNNQLRSRGPVSESHDLNRQNSMSFFTKIEENQFRDLCEDPKEAETINQWRSSGKKADGS